MMSLDPSSNEHEQVVRSEAFRSERGGRLGERRDVARSGRARSCALGRRSAESTRIDELGCVEGRAARNVPQGTHELAHHANDRDELVVRAVAAARSVPCGDQWIVLHETQRTGTSAPRVDLDA